MLIKHEWKIENFIRHGSILRSYNAPEHFAHISERTIEKLGIEVVCHLTYLLDLASCDFFPKRKIEFSGCHFGPDEKFYLTKGVV